MQDSKLVRMRSTVSQAKNAGSEFRAVPEKLSPYSASIRAATHWCSCRLECWVPKDTIPGTAVGGGELICLGKRTRAPSSIASVRWGGIISGKDFPQERCSLADSSDLMLYILSRWGAPPRMDKASRIRAGPPVMHSPRSRSGPRNISYSFYFGRAALSTAQVTRETGSRRTRNATIRPTA